MLEKTIALMQNVWLRGAVLIVKKFKMMRPRDQLQKMKDSVLKERDDPQAFSDFTLPLYTFKGLQMTDKSDHDEEAFRKQADQVATFNYEGLDYESKPTPIQQYCLRTAAAHQNVHLRMFCIKDGFSCKDNFTEFNEEQTVEKLQDIRDNPAYVNFVRLIGGLINFDENGYENLSKEFKRELKYAAGNLMQHQLRAMVDESVVVFVNFFKGFKTFSQLSGRVTDFGPIRHVKSVVSDFTLKPDFQEAVKLHGKDFNKVVEYAETKPT
jgi:hypothetical protein